MSDFGFVTSWNCCLRSGSELRSDADRTSRPTARFCVAVTVIGNGILPAPLAAGGCRFPGRGFSSSVVAFEGAALLPAAYGARWQVDRGHGLFGDQHSVRAAGDFGVVPERSKHTCCEPDLVSAEDGLKGVERPQSRRGRHRAVDSRRHGGQSKSRSQGETSLAESRGRRARGRTECVAGLKNMSGESIGSWRAFLDDMAAHGLRVPESSS